MAEPETPPDGGHGQRGNGMEYEPHVTKEIVKDFIKVVRDVIPALDQMKNSIQDSSHKIPTASRQLNSVTQATETATVEILDVLDSLGRRISSFEDALADSARRASGLQDLASEIDRRLQKLVSTLPGESLCTDVRDFWMQYLAASSKTDLLDCARISLAEARNEITNIAMALQVQDITAQQIAGVIHLIESVRKQLTHVLDGFENIGDAQPAGDTKQNDLTFNADAQYQGSAQRQQVADTIINEWGSDSHNKAD